MNEIEYDRGDWSVTEVLRVLRAASRMLSAQNKGATQLPSTCGCAPLGQSRYAQMGGSDTGGRRASDARSGWHGRSRVLIAGLLSTHVTRVGVLVTVQPSGVRCCVVRSGTVGGPRLTPHPLAPFRYHDQLRVLIANLLSTCTTRGGLAGPFLRDAWGAAGPDFAVAWSPTTK